MISIFLKTNLFITSSLRIPRLYAIIGQEINRRNLSFLRISSSHTRNTIDPFTGGADLSFSFDLSPILKDVRSFNASSPIFSTTTHESI